MTNPIVNGKRTHRKPRNGHNHVRGDRGANGVMLSPPDAARVRALIDTVNIVKRLNTFILGDADREVTRKRKNSKGQVEEYTIYLPVMTATQVSAAIALLKKTVPDLLSAKIETDDPNSPLQIEYKSMREQIIDGLTKMGKLKRLEDGSYALA